LSGAGGGGGGTLSNGRPIPGKPANIVTAGERLFSPLLLLLLLLLKMMKMMMMMMMVREYSR